jgi:hypothetical protein
MQKTIWTEINHTYTKTHQKNFIISKSKDHKDDRKIHLNYCYFTPIYIFIIDLNIKTKTKTKKKKTGGVGGLYLLCICCQYFTSYMYKGGSPLFTNVLKSWDAFVRKSLMLSERLNPVEAKSNEWWNLWHIAQKTRYVWNHTAIVMTILYFHTDLTHKCIPVRYNSFVKI